jgi:hypothetical protein
MATVTGAGSPPPVNWGSFGLDETQLQELQTRFGPGQFAPLPQADAAEIGRQLGMTPPLDMNIGDIFALVAALKTKVEETSLDITQNEVKNTKEQQKAKSAERMEKLQEQVDKMNESKKGGLVGEIFGWIAAAAMTIAGAIMVATGVGAAAGVALLAAGITMLAVQALTSDALGQAFGLEGNLMNAMTDAIVNSMVDSGMIGPEDAEKAKLVVQAVVTAIVVAAAVVAGTIAGGPALGISLAASSMTMFFTPENLERMGMSKEDAGWAAMGISIGLAVVGVVAGGVSAKFPGGLAKDIGTAATKTATTAVDVASDAAAVADQIGAMTKTVLAKLASGISLVVGALATVGQGAATGVSTDLAYKAKQAEADAEEMKGQLAMIAALMARKSEDLEDILKRIQENAAAVMQVINGTAATAKSVIDINNRPLGA